jgi:creatinine amidohydrolase
MILARMTWPEVEAISRDVVVLIPTGSLEQHGPHLPLFTDSLLATYAAAGVEARLPSSVLLTPTLWLGASGHHLAFPGSLSASFEGYQDAIVQVVESLIPHGFLKFYVLNGHGGNTELNGIACRKLKEKHRELVIGHAGYFSFIPDSLLASTMEGPLKGIRHACEAEASLMLHCHPDLVRMDRLRDDGLKTSSDVPGLVWMFDEMTEQGSYGYATYASAEKGRVFMDAAIEGAAAAMKALADGVWLEGI